MVEMGFWLLWWSLRVLGWGGRMACEEVKRGE